MQTADTQQQRAIASPSQHLMPAADLKRVHSAVNYRPSLHPAATDSCLPLRESSKRQATKSTEMKTSPITVEEFEALPVSIQKKYFSPVERLRIAEHAAVPKRLTKSNNLSSGDDSLPGEPYSSSAHRRSKESVANRLRKDSAIIDFTNVSTEEAAWYLALPDKIRRQHFSREEEILLVEQCQFALDRSSADIEIQSIYDRKAKTAGVPGRLTTSCDFDFQINSDQLDFDDFSRAAERSEREMEIFRKYSKRHEAMASTRSGIPPTSPTLKRSSFRRRLSLGSIHKPRLISLAPPLRSTPLTSGYAKLGKSVPSSVDIMQPSLPSPKATYYQDPDARQKVRQYLASPQRFDEAVEFGFPLQYPGTRCLTSPGARHHGPGDHKAFELEDDTSSVFSEYTMDDETPLDSESAPESEGPVTPPANAHAFRPMVVKHHTAPSISSLARPSTSKGRSIDTHRPFDIGAREMTLRMTLTRPDLRAPEEDLYGWQKKLEPAAAAKEDADPLALEDLIVSEDVTGSQGAFAITRGIPQSNSKGVSGLWRRLTKH